ncbi:lysozyme family protein [Variovorax boronicumulans]|uniref:glycoside hydrolase family 108 protein n=1 Tax=Variovorax boronicumulans TaxID=436515 RepID=UPI00278A4FE4|nr:glycosyl hydrolase 108 family protein [Variovorax boronicumulans]MDQ0035837.1 lysozyme family protein [Variovorax boronicumulans]
MNFDQAFERLLGHEGGYVNDPDDPGGETNWGITIAVARAEGYTGPMRDLPVDTAKEIYRKRYWTAVRADELPDLVRFDVFDGAVNHGASQSAKWLQRAVGAQPDGVIGAQTVAAARAAGSQIGAHYNGQRLQFYTDLTIWPKYSKGWARRVASNLLNLKD